MNQEPKTPQLIRGGTAKYILLSLIIVIVTAFSAFSVLYFIGDPRGSREEDGVSEVAIPYNSLEELLVDIKKVVNSPGELSSSLYDAASGTAVIRRVDNTSWVSVMRDESIANVRVTRDTQRLSDKDEETILSRLKEKGFSRSDHGSSRVLTYFESDSIICNMRRSVGESLVFAVRIGCAMKDSYVANIEKLSPFIKTYNGNKNDVYFRHADIQDSFTEGYQNAIVTTQYVADDRASSVLFYYKKPASQDWVYVASAKNKDAASCSVYDRSEELQGAFYGFTCVDDATGASRFVETPNPTFEVEPGALGG